MHMPVLNPATVQEYLDFGLAGWALSRFVSSWVGMICLNDTADSAATVDVDPSRPSLILPPGIVAPPTLGHDAQRRPRRGAGASRRRSAPSGTPRRRRSAGSTASTGSRCRRRRRGTDRGIGIITAGKGYLDVSEGLVQLGITPERAGEMGLSVLKLAMTFPVDPEVVLEFADGLDEVLVIEPKHPIIEDQVGAHPAPGPRRPPSRRRRQDRRARRAADPVVGRPRRHAGRRDPARAHRAPHG